jgi:hypothetical protein
MNDLLFLRKKKKAAEDAGQDYVGYAVRVLMVDRSISEQETIRVYTQKIIEDMSAFNTTM